MMSPSSSHRFTCSHDQIALTSSPLLGLFEVVPSSRCFPSKTTLVSLVRPAWSGDRCEIGLTPSPELPAWCLSGCRDHRGPSGKRSRDSWVCLALSILLASYFVGFAQSRAGRFQEYFIPSRWSRILHSGRQQDSFWVLYSILYKKINWVSLGLSYPWRLRQPPQLESHSWFMV